MTSISCCIDKKSSAELGEAINTMFRWYKNATVCYVYLFDCVWGEQPDITQQLRQCRWFTRGWTLQELIAPQCLEFYTKEWRKIATKTEICPLISEITGIDENVLRGASLDHVSVARRMSWASRRETSRAEDTAYSLLGIFEVNIPMIYGEGRLKAFRRLQEAIMNTTHDQSLFAWGRIVDCPSDALTEDHRSGRTPLRWKAPREREALLGLFAECPADFKDSSGISPVDHGYAHHLNRHRPPTMVNGGALVNLVVFDKFMSVTYWDDLEVVQPDFHEIALLLCRVGNTGSKLVGLVLHSWGEGYCSRTREMFPVNAFVSHIRFQGWTKSRHFMLHRPFRLRNGDILCRKWVTRFKSEGVKRPTTDSGPAWRQRWRDKVLRLEEDAVGDEAMRFFYQVQPGEGVAITLQRLSKTRNPLGPLVVGASLTESLGNEVDDGLVMPKWVPKNVKSLSNPEVAHVMKTPVDHCRLQLKGRIRIDVMVNRMPLDEGRGGNVDVLDLFMYKNDESPLPEHRQLMGLVYG